MASTRDPSPVRINGYEHFSEIGRGGAAVVYAAVQLPLRREVAVKVLQADLSDDVARRRFERECQAVVALGDAPGIVPVYGVAFTDDGRGCIVMRRMRESLADVVRREGPLAPALVRRIGIVAATALAHAHGRGVTHRDVTPANLLVSEFGDVALADFDIAVVGGVTSAMTTSGSLSPPHSPPERLRGATFDGAAGDVWSLGSTLYTLLAGHPPFGSVSSDGGMAGLVDRVLNDPTPPIGVAGVPAELEAVVRRALEKEPEHRWPDAAAFAAALEAVVVPAVAQVDAQVAAPVVDPVVGLDVDAASLPDADDTTAPPLPEGRGRREPDVRSIVARPPDRAHELHHVERRLAGFAPSIVAVPDTE